MHCGQTKSPFCIHVRVQLCPLPCLPSATLWECKVARMPTARLARCCCSRNRALMASISRVRSCCQRTSIEVLSSWIICHGLEMHMSLDCGQRCWHLVAKLQRSVDPSWLSTLEACYDPCSTHAPLLTTSQYGSAEAQHVLLVEPLLDPAVEAQAVGRVHRIGQVCAPHVMCTLPIAPVASRPVLACHCILHDSSLCTCCRSKAVHAS